MVAIESEAFLPLFSFALLIVAAAARIGMTLWVVFHVVALEADLDLEASSRMSALTRTRRLEFWMVGLGIQVVPGPQLYW